MQDLYEKWRVEPTPDNMNELLKSYDRLLVSETQRYAGPKDIMHAKARSLAVGSIKSYKPEANTKLSTWIVTGLKPLSRYGHDIGPVRTPEVAKRRAAELNRLSDEFRQEHDRQPTDIELADASGISVRSVGKLRYRVKPVMSESMSQLSAGSEDTALVDKAVSYTNPVPQALDSVYETLTPEERFIVDNKMGRQGVVMSNQDIATRLKLTPARISQITAGIAKRIQETADALGSHS